MRKPRPKMSDMVPHPLPGYAKAGAKVTRREALDIQERETKQRAEIERRKITNQLTPRLKETPGWEQQIAEIAGDLKVTPQAIMLAFQKYDARVAAGEASLALMLPFELSGPSTVTRFDKRTGQPYERVWESPVTDEEKVQAMVEHALTTCEPTKPRAKTKLPRRRRTREAIRKAKARAEGRVKPRPRKGPMTLEARLAAAEKSVETRLETLRQLEADPNASDGDKAKCLAGLARASKAVATWAKRLHARFKSERRSDLTD